MRTGRSTFTVMRNTVLRAKELPAIERPKLDCIHKRKQDRGKRRSSSCEKYSNKCRSRIVDGTIASQLPRSTQHTANFKHLVDEMGFEPTTSSLRTRKNLR
jgi:hypothetical protein